MVQGTVRVGLHISVCFPGPGLITGGPELFQVLFPAPGNIIPHFQEHHRKAPDSFPLQTKPRIFPVTKSFYFIHIFICQIDASCKAHLTVRHQNFPMVPVVHNHRHYGIQRIKPDALYAPFLHLLIVFFRKGGHTPEIIINKTYIQSLSCLLL